MSSAVALGAPKAVELIHVVDSIVLLASLIPDWCPCLGFGGSYECGEEFSL